MTGHPEQDLRNTKDERLQALLRADAAAILDDDLDDETDYDHARVDTAGDESRPRVEQRQRSQVYSIRVPVDRLEQVRSLAKERGVAPTAMLRDWTLAQLDVAMGSAPSSRPSSDVSSSRPSSKQNSPRRQDNESLEAVCARLEAATEALLGVITQLTTVLARSVELIAAPQPTASTRRDLQGMSPQQGFAIAPVPYAARLAFPATNPLAAASLSGTSWQMQTDPYFARSCDYVIRGVAKLRATVSSAPSWPGLNEDNFDLDDLYMTADEELSKS